MSTGTAALVSGHCCNKTDYIFNAVALLASGSGPSKRLNSLRQSIPHVSGAEIGEERSLNRVSGCDRTRQNIWMGGALNVMTLKIRSKL